MCISPVSILNPNYGLKFSPGDPNSLKDCTSAMIRVPCGHCSECIAVKQMYLVQRLQMEALSNYIFFSTLTYNRYSLPRIDTSSGFSIPYADIRDVRMMIKRLRKYNRFCRPFRYLYVTELGKQHGRPHFHVLWLVPRYRDDDEYTGVNLEKKLFDNILYEWRRNYGSTRAPIYKPLCTYQRLFKDGRCISNYDTHLVRSGSDSDESSVGFYVLKYMLKPSDRETRLQQALRLNLPEDEYNSVWNIVRSRCECSRGFGLNPDSDGNIDPKILDYLRECIDSSKDFAKFFSPTTGKSFPLSRYYRSKSQVYKFDDAIRFYFDSDSEHLDSPIESDNKDYAQLLNSVRLYEKKVSDVADRGDYDNYADDFD